MTKSKPKISAKNPEDRDKSAVMQKVLEYQWSKYSNVIEAIAILKLSTEQLYGIELPRDWGQKIIEEVMRLELEE